MEIDRTHKHTHSHPVIVACTGPKLPRPVSYSTTTIRPVYRYYTPSSLGGGDAIPLSHVCRFACFDGLQRRRRRSERTYVHLPAPAPVDFCPNALGNIRAGPLVLRAPSYTTRSLLSFCVRVLFVCRAVKSRAEGWH